MLFFRVRPYGSACRQTCCRCCLPTQDIRNLCAEIRTQKSVQLYWTQLLRVTSMVIR